MKLWSSSITKNSPGNSLSTLQKPALGDVKENESSGSPLTVTRNVPRLLPVPSTVISPTTRSTRGTAGRVIGGVAVWRTTKVASMAAIPSSWLTPKPGGGACSGPLAS